MEKDESYKSTEVTILTKMFNLNDLNFFIASIFCLGFVW